MNWVDDCVAIGNLVDANNVDMLRKENIDLIIDVRTAFDFDFSEMSYTLICDRGEKITILLTALSNLKAKVLIHCLEGIDRTPFVVMLCIAQKHNMTYKDAYDLVKQKRPNTRFHWEWVKCYEDFRRDSKK
ncbi:MAG: dual specificity protein phosphatase family protein [Candidatus Bathyarchaeia archaeon]